MGVLRVSIALVLVACSEPAATDQHASTIPVTCPERMVRVPGGGACIDRYEARVDHGQAMPAVDAPAAHGLTWFEADRACREVGYRLCSVDEYERACGGVDRRRTYSYGSDHVPRRCNIPESDDEPDSRRVVESGSFPECVTPEGVYDLTGNALEWLADEGSGGGLYAIRGGSTFQPESSAKCVRNNGGWLVPDEEAAGFRCCARIARSD
jgi:formylglycine-generating enzyme required for sulfatase activity